MDIVLQGLMKTAQAYVDDILVFADGSTENHIQDLELVFFILREHKMKFKLSRICRQSEWYVTRPRESENHFQQPPHLPPPPPPHLNVTAVKSFVETCSYYRRFINRSSDIASLIFDATKIGAGIQAAKGMSISQNSSCQFAGSLPLSSFRNTYFVYKCPWPCCRHLFSVVRNISWWRLSGRPRFLCEQMLYRSQQVIYFRKRRRRN